MDARPQVCLVSTIGRDSETPIRMWLATLLQAGYQVTVVMPQAGDSKFRSVPLPAVPYFWPGSRLLQVANILLRRTANSALLLFHLLRLRPQVCICSEPDAWMVSVLARFFTRMKVILYLREVFEDRLQSFPKSTRGFLRAALRGTMKWLSARTDEIVHVSDARQEWYQYLSKRGRVIHHYPGRNGHASLDGVLPLESTTWPVTFVHAGALRPTYGSDLLLEGFAEALKSRPDLRLLVIGGVAGELGSASLLARLIADGSLQIMERVPHEQVLRLLPACDVGLVHVAADSVTTRLAEPTKLYEYLAAGLPVLASDVPTLRAVLGQWDCGLLFDASQPQSLARCILQLAEDQTLRERLACNALRASESELNWEREQPKLIRLMQSLAATVSGSPAQ